MNPSGKAFISPDGAVAFWSNGELRSKVYLKKGSVTISVKAHGNTVDGESPILLVDLGTRTIGKFVINSQVSKGYTINTAVGDTGTTILGLSFSNHLAKPNPLAGRNLAIEVVTITQGGG